MKEVDERQILNILHQLNECQSRWYVAREAISFGRGGIKLMNKITGISRTTIIKGIKELKAGSLSLNDRIRIEGGGRKRLEEKDLQLRESLNKIMEEDTAGNPMNFVKWTNKSLHKIEKEIKRRGHNMSYRTIGRRLKEMGYSLQGNKKTFEGLAHPERDAQFHYINHTVGEFVKKKQPVISVDTKKKELVGNFKNSGRIWTKKGQAKHVNAYDFPSFAKGKAVPYGAYDIILNKGFVNVGISYDTAEFAVESIRQWWKQLGKKHYPKAKELLITADSGGSNGSRNRGWKYFLYKLSKETKLKITVLHFPPATSKWNKIEHRMFSFISQNWKGKPLTDFEVIINFIKSTTTTKGLQIFARLDKAKYQRGKKFTDEDMSKIMLIPHEIYPGWNYTILPK